MGAGGRRRANDLLTLQGQHWSLLYGRHTAFNSLRFAHRRESSNPNTHEMVGQSVHDPECVEFWSRLIFHILTVH